MGKLKRKLATTAYKDLLDVPDTMIAEILDCELVVSPRPSGINTLAASSLTMEIGSPFHHGKGGGPGGWWILGEPELEFDSGVDHIVPDLAGWRRERMPKIPSDHRFKIIPDWVCEIVSPSSRRRNRVKKFNLYARYGVLFYWLIEPESKTLEAFELVGGRWQLVGAYEVDEKVRVKPFDAIELDLSLLWAPDV